MENELAALRLLSVDALCELLSIGRTKAFELISGDEFEVIHIGRRTLITQQSITAFVSRCPRRKVAGNA